MEEVFLVFIPSVLRQGPRGGSKGCILAVEKLDTGILSIKLFLWIFLFRGQIHSP